jgi:hypothetical protein
MFVRGRVAHSPMVGYGSMLLWHAVVTVATAAAGRLSMRVVALVLHACVQRRNLLAGRLVRLPLPLL